MSLIVNSIGDQPYIPGSVGYLYTSDQLIAGDQKLVTGGNATITGGLLLPRGTVLGKVALGALTPAGPTGTGNGTITLITAGTRTRTGVYRITMTGAATFTVTNPVGEALANGVNGAYANPELNFTITAGATPFVAGDFFTVTVAGGSNAWKKAVATAVDGSNIPAAILAEQSDASSGDVNGGIYLTGEFNENRVAYDVSFTLQAVKDLLREYNIHLKSAIIADPPT